MKSEKFITPGDLQLLIEYDPKTGGLIWRERSQGMFGHNGPTHVREVNRWNSRHAGTPALTYVCGDGYLRGNIWKRQVWAHRVAWAIYYGEWPEREIDHINGDPADNRIENLRVVCRSLNMKNTRKRRNNTSGYTGVTRHVGTGKWQARIQVEGKEVSLGLYPSAKEAGAARKKAERQHGYHQNHGRLA